MTRDSFSIYAAAGLLTAGWSFSARAADGYLLGGGELPPGTTVDWSTHREIDLQVKILSGNSESPDKEKTIADWKGRLTIESPGEAAFEVTAAAVKRHLDPEPEGELRSALTKGSQYLFEKKGGAWTLKHRDGSRVEGTESNELSTIDPAAVTRLDALIFGAIPAIIGRSRSKAFPCWTLWNMRLAPSPWSSWRSPRLVTPIARPSSCIRISKASGPPG